MTKKTWLNLIYILTATVMGCNDDKWEGLELQTDLPHEISNEAQIIRIPIVSSSDWSVRGNTTRWCQTSQAKGESIDTLIVTTEANIAKTRRELTLKLGNDIKTVNVPIRQAAATGEYNFRLPIIFHVLYSDKNNSKENIPQAKLMRYLDKVNALYANASGKSGDMKIQFIPAMRDPEGHLLDEAGIHRVYRPGLPMDPDDFLKNKFGDISWIWSPREYINVVIFPFGPESNTLGKAYLPYMPESHPLDGLSSSDQGNRIKFPAFFSDIHYPMLLCIISS